MRYLLWITLFIFEACESPTQPEDTKYNYSEDFKAYFKAVSNEEIRQGKEYFIVPLNSCAQCVDSALARLANYNYPWVVILTGQTEDNSRLRNIEITKTKYVCIIDSTSVISEYSVNIGLPSLLKANKEGQITYKKDFHYGSWQLSDL